jgi:hypothetical protein
MSCKGYVSSGHVWVYTARAVPAGLQVGISSLTRRVTVPFHASKVFHPKVLNNILRDADLNIDALEKLL